MRKIALVLTLLGAPMLQAQETAKYEKHVFEKNGQKLPYRLLKPAKIEDGKKYPLVLFLHGAGERGDNNEAQLVHGSGLFLKPKNREAYPAFVLFPQCPNNKRWVEVDWGQKTTHKQPSEPSLPMGLTKAVVDELIKDQPIDSKRIYVMGLSMGGFGTWDWAARYPELTAAIAPICGGADDSTAEKLKTIPAWAFHGTDDTAVWPQRSRSMVDALKKAGGTVRYSEYEKVGHFSWGRAFDEPELLPWMFAQKKQ
ncbi:MAG: dienelactone hydrolase family protein [Gemmataceae bacterium]|nr:dienelactone hydrolase family protein [Gemmataceae bacterium]